MLHMCSFSGCACAESNTSGQSVTLGAEFVPSDTESSVWQVLGPAGDLPHTTIELETKYQDVPRTIVLGETEHLIERLLAMTVAGEAFGSVEDGTEDSEGCHDTQSG